MEDLNYISLYGGSDFFNLTILTNLMLQKEREKNSRIESLKKPTFGRWIWSTLKDIGEGILKIEGYREKVLWDEGTIEVSYRRHILGIERFEVEYAWA